MTVEELKILILADATKLREELSKAKESILDFNRDLKKEFKSTEGNITSIFSGLGKKLVGIFAGLQIGKFIVKSIKESMNSIEYESLFQVSFGKLADSMRDWSKEIATTLNLNLSDLRRTTATVYEMVKSMGIGQESAVKMAKGVALLSQDMGSFLHRDPTEMYHKIISGLMGQTRGLHLLGKAITEATVKEYAYTHGIAQSGTQLSEQQKLISRYLLLLEQTKVMHGNLAQTMNSPANQMRMFNANMKALCQTLGNLFIPLLNAIIPYINAFVQLITMALDAIRKFFGVKSNEEYAKSLHEGIDNTTASTNKLDKSVKKTDKDAKKLKDTLASFDEMNVLKEPILATNNADTGLGGLGGYGNPFDFPLPDYNPHLEWVKDNVKRIVDEVKNYFSGIDFTPLAKSFENLKKAIDPIVGDISKSLKWFMDNILRPLATWTIENVLPAFFDILAESLRILQPLLETVGSTFKWWWDNIFEPIAKWTGGVFVWTLQQIAGWLKLIADSPEAMEFLKDIVQIVTGLGIALLTVSTAIKVVQLAMAGFQLILGLVTTPIGLVVLAILAIATAIALVVKYFPEIKQGFINTFNAIKEAIGKVATWFKNTIKRFFEDPINAVIDSFKWLFNTLSGNKVKVTTSTPQYTAPNTAPKLGVPKFATGGIVNRPTYAQIGESGKEAVVPLEQNTGWIDMLASKLGNNGQPINLTVKIGEDNIISRVIDGINNKSMQMGRGVVMV